jgi:hypothetical protein
LDVPEVEGGHQGHGDEIHMPPNSWWPLVAAVGLTFLLTGLIVGPVLWIPGAIVLLVGIGGWIRDARKEYLELH